MENTFDAIENIRSDFKMLVFGLLRRPRGLWFGCWFDADGSTLLAPCTTSYLARSEPSQRFLVIVPWTHDARNPALVAHRPCCITD